MSQLNNPYAPPEADDESPVSSIEEGMVLASQGARFANFIVDSIARTLFSVVLVGILPGLGPISRGVLSMLLAVGYYVILEAAFQATLGKLITRTRVVSATGAKPRFTQILGRSLARFVPFEPFSLLGRNPVGWHDSWSSTRVVKLDSLREN